MHGTILVCDFEYGDDQIDYAECNGEIHIITMCKEVSVK
jgi:hypothetical protein